MSTNQPTQPLENIIQVQKTKPLQTYKLHNSFQQLYELLSKQAETEKVSISNPQRIKQKQKTNTNQKLKIEYTAEPQRYNFADTSNPEPTNNEGDIKQTISFTEQGQSSATEMTFKIRKKTTISVSHTNQKLKEMILGKKGKRGLSTGKSSLRIATEPQRNRQKEQGSNLLYIKNKINHVSHDKVKIQQYIDKAKKHMKQMNDKVSLCNFLNEASPRHIKLNPQQKPPQLHFKVVRQNKKVTIDGEELKKGYDKTKQAKVKKVMKFKQDYQMNSQILKRRMRNMQAEKKGSTEGNITSKSNIKPSAQVVVIQNHQENLVSEHILSKVFKIFEFGDFILNTYKCRIKHMQLEKLPKFSRKNKMYTYFVGPGNNRNLIVEKMSKRWWWRQVATIDSADFVWTQEKVKKIFLRYENEENMLSTSLSEGSKEKQKTVMETKKISDANHQKCGKQNLTASYKAILKESQGKEDIQTVNSPKCLHNHLTNSNILGDKKFLYQLLKSRKVDFQKMDIDQLFDIIPHTYHITSEDSMEFRYFQQIFQLKKEEPNNLWIVKPGQNSNRGRDIFVSGSFDQIQQAVKTRNSLNGTTIIQRYKSDLLLYRGRKFDIRTFLLCVFIGDNCKFYWFSHGYIRTSSHQFNVQNLNMMIHLTNDAIQIQGQNYGKFQKGNKLSYHQLQNYLKDTFPQKDMKIDNLINKMKDTAKELALSSYCMIDRQTNKHGFELFGLDFIVDTDFKPWLLEVNTNPCLQITSPLLQTMMPNLIDNVFRLAVDPLFPPTMCPDKEHEYFLADKFFENNKFELIFDSITERDQYWENYCAQNVISSSQKLFQ